MSEGNNNESLMLNFHFMTIQNNELAVELQFWKNWTPILEKRQSLQKKVPLTPKKVTFAPPKKFLTLDSYRHQFLQQQKNSAKLPWHHNIKFYCPFVFLSLRLFIDSSLCRFVFKSFSLCVFFLWWIFDKRNERNGQKPNHPFLMQMQTEEAAKSLARHIIRNKGRPTAFESVRE